MNQPYVICFSGMPGTFKSQLAHRISLQYALPRFERDLLREEAKTDHDTDDVNDPLALKQFNETTQRLVDDLLSRKISFVLDSSVDRRWPEIKSQLTAAGYKFMVISLDLSEGYVRSFYERYATDNLPHFEGYSAQHQAFVQEHQADIALSIKDADIPRRIELALAAVARFLAK